MRFREEHTALVEAINAQTAATKAQTGLIEVLCSELKAMNAKMDVLCSHTSRLENVEGDVATIKNAFQVVVDKAEAVSSRVSGLSDHIDDIGLVFRERISDIKRADEKRLSEEAARQAELKAQERRQAEEAARLEEEQESEERRNGEEALTVSFSGKDLETMTNGVEALKEWTGKASAAIVFDSTVDEFTHKGLFNKVEGKENIAVIGFTADGDMFGGFYSKAVTEPEKKFFDPSIFIFSFESHGRCAMPQQFIVKEGMKEDVFVRFDKNGRKGFVFFGVYGFGGFFLGNQTSDSYCWDISRVCDGLVDTTLTGKNNGGDKDNGEYHRCTRLIAVQLE